MPRKISNELFIEECNLVHENKYNYSKCKYVKMINKITITCSIHGDFEQTAIVHKRGAGCTKCGKENRSKILNYSNIEFILKCNKTHHNKYDYSKCVYTRSCDNVIIICKEHGEFTIKANKHCNGQGCKLCGYISSSKSNTSNYKIFTEKANTIHNNKFDYSKSVYNGSHKKIEIICAKHGSFWQTPTNHFSGAGCSKCNASRGELFISNYFISNDIKFEEQKRFSECRNILPLPFDFYLLEYNLLIEYQGKQHFENIKTGKFKTINLDERKKLDKIKKDFALNNNFNFLEITYKDNINKKLNEYFKSE